MHKVKFLSRLRHMCILSITTKQFCVNSARNWTFVTITCIDSERGARTLLHVCRAGSPLYSYIKQQLLFRQLPLPSSVSQQIRRHYFVKLQTYDVIECIYRGDSVRFVKLVDSFTRILCRTLFTVSGILDIHGVSETGSVFVIRSTGRRM
jgi:hypothetical protein